MKSFGIAGFFYLAGTWFSPTFDLLDQSIEVKAQAEATQLLPASAAVPLPATLPPAQPSDGSPMPEETLLATATVPAASGSSVHNLSGRLVPWVNSHSIYPDAVVRFVEADGRSQSLISGEAPEPLFTSCLDPQKASDHHDYVAQAPYQVWVSEHLVAAFPTQELAEQMVRQVRDALEDPSFDATTLVPAQSEEAWQIQAGDRPLVTLEDSLPQTFQRHGDLIAIDWTNNLRHALGAERLSLAEAQRKLYGLEDGGLEDGGNASRDTLGGTASWYGPYFHKRQTANGERFDQFGLTAAHKTLPFGSFLEVTNVRNGQSVIVRINDRGPYVGRRSLDLSFQAAQCINSDEAGVVPYEAIVLTPLADPATTAPATAQAETAQQVSTLIKTGNETASFIVDSILE